MGKQATKKDKIRFLKQLKANRFHISKTCEAFGVTRGAYYLWKKEEWFSDMEKDMYESEIDIAEDSHRLLREGIPIEDEGVLIGWIEKPDRQAIETFLRKAAKHRGWGETQENQNVEIRVKIDRGT
jgi:hypothetical protein